MLRNLERISRENYEIFVWWKMPKTLDIARILREQKEQLRAGFQDRLVMTASITLRVCYLIVFFLAFRILDRDHFGQVFYRLENGVFWTSFGVLHLASSRGRLKFQDRLVMTASITLRVCYLIVFFLAFRILDRDHFGQVFYRSENGVFWTSFGGRRLA